MSASEGSERAKEIALKVTSEISYVMGRLEALANPIAPLTTDYYNEQITDVRRMLDATRDLLAEIVFPK